MIHELFKIIEERKKNPTVGSYTNFLLESGGDRIAQKFGEEAIELVVAASNQSDQRVMEESADLIYHLLVLLAYKGITLTDIEKELEARHHGAENK
ncbi:MAG: phosphoribosyl-ATP diphosphatase [Chloroflexi bacterium]|nr:phosphoribosyl-ATP diphosphatase [Chloroflexota bacterium]